MEEKRQISITLTDLDNTQQVLVILFRFFQTLIKYYAEKEDLTALNNLILNCANYFGTILSMIGYRPEDFEGEE